MSRALPVVIQRGLLLADQRAPDPARVDELVAFQRAVRCRVLLLARQPVRWRPTRNSVDQDLGLQQVLHQSLRRAGVDLDGVLYLRVGLFARRQTRLDELLGLTARYRMEPAELVVIGSDATLLESVVQFGGRAQSVGEKVTGAGRHPSLQAALSALH